MAEAKAGAARPQASRPLSPHIFIFRPYVNMVMSIVHRITGAANYFGSLLLAAWLISAAAGDEKYNAIGSILGSPVGLIVLFGFTWSLMHHMLGGIRHFIWDSGYGFAIPSIRFLSWATIFGSLTLTGLIWMVGLYQWGVR